MTVGNLVAPERANMKPRFNADRVWRNPRHPNPPAYRPTAKELSNDSRLSRGEASLFLVLTAAVMLAFADHALVLQGFMRELPEFAAVVANLVRDAV